MNEGDALAGNIYESQRNDELFVEPNEFDSARFVDSVRVLPVISSS